MLPKKIPSEQKNKALNLDLLPDLKSGTVYFLTNTLTVRSLLQSLATVFGRRMWYCRRTKTYVPAPAAKQLFLASNHLPANCD